MKNILKNDNSQTSKKKRRRATFNLLIVVTFLLQLILPVGLHVNAMGEAGEIEEAVTAQMQEAEDPEKAEEEAARKAEEEAARKAEEEAARKAEEEAARKAEKEAARKAEEEAARKAEEEAARKAEEETARKAEEEAARKAEEEAARKAEEEAAEEVEEKKEAENADENKEDESSPSKTEEVEADREEEVAEHEEVEEDLEEINEEDIIEEAEKYPDMLGEPALVFPSIGFGMMRTRAVISDTITVDKNAERTKDEEGNCIGCRTFEVVLDITGTPQEAPVDVVLVIDRSGSMAAGNVTEYVAIENAPSTNKNYYVHINGSYQQVSYSGGRWYYGSGSSRRYVSWDANGDDNASGGNSSNPVGKPFYESFGRSRMYLAKQAAVNFAAKVLGPSGVPGSRVSIVSYSGPTTTTGSGSYGVQGHANTDQDLTSDISLVNSAIAGLSANGGTNTEAGFIQSKNVIQGSISNQNPNSNKVVIMFTDGMPTSSNGNAYGPNDPTSHNNHTIAAYTAGQDIYNNGIADVFTVGLFEGMTGSVYNLAVDTLTRAQNKGFKDAPTAAALAGIFDDISTQLGYAATNAKVVDKIGDHFDLIESSLPAGATYDANTREIKWNPGTIYDSAQLKYQVVAKPDFPGGQADTNEYATLTYTDVFGNTGQSKDFPVPNVNVPTLIEVSLTDATINLGDSISLGSGTDENGENYMSPVTGGDNDGTNFTYEWRKVGDSTEILTDKNPSVSPTEDTEYEVRVTDSNGCIAIATMTVTINKKIGKISISKMIKDLDNIMDLTFFGSVDPAMFINQEFDIKVTGPNNYQQTVTLKHGETVVLDELFLGEYSVEEINVDTQFMLENIDPASFELTNENRFVEVDVLNKVNYATFEFIKVDEKGNPLANIEFELSKGNVTQTVTTGADGKVSFNFLEPGEYELKETKTKPGYKLPTDTWIIEVVKNGSTGELTIMIQDESFLTLGPEENTMKNEKQSEFPQTGGLGGLSYIAAGLTILTTSLGIYIKKEEK